MPQPYANNRFPEDSWTAATWACHENLLNKLVGAFKQTGTVRSREWRNAHEKMMQFETEHGKMYNPD